METEDSRWGNCIFTRKLIYTHTHTQIFIGSDNAKKGAPAMWLAAIMAKCHKAILAYRGARRNHSDLSALGLPSMFQSHTNSSLQISCIFFGLFVRKVIWLYPASCFVIWGCRESSYLASWTRTECVSMIYRNGCDSASMNRRLRIWQCIRTNAFLHEWFYLKSLRLF